MTNRPMKSGGFPTDLTDAGAILGPNWWVGPPVNPPSNSKPVIWFLTLQKYAQTLQKYVDYKEYLGFETKVLCIDGIERTPSSIRNFLINEYNNSKPKANFLLIVGSPTDIPYSAGENENTDNPPTDIYYSCLENVNIADESLTPEFALGRWPVFYISYLQNIINKSIKYEAVVSEYDVESLNIMLLSGSGEHDYMFIKDANVLQSILENNGLNRGIVYDGREYSTGSIQNIFINNLKNKMWMFIYRGHGNYNCIGSPLLLRNPSSNSSDYLYSSQCYYNQIPPLTFSFACLTNNNVGHSMCIGDSWICEEEDVGGVIHFGSTTISYSDSNHNLSKKIIELFDDKNNYRIGNLIDKGKMEYYECKTISKKKQIKNTIYLVILL